MKNLFLTFVIAIMLIFTFNLSSISAAEATEETPIAEESEAGFFEKLGVAIFDYIGSEDFTRIVTTISALAIAVYPFISKYLSAKAKAKYEATVAKTANAKNEALVWKAAALKYGKHLDSERTYWATEFNSVKEALSLAFNQSNLKSDVKDEINKIFASASSIKPEQATLDAVLQDEIAKQSANQLNPSLEDEIDKLDQTTMEQSLEQETSKGW